MQLLNRLEALARGAGMVLLSPPSSLLRPPSLATMDDDAFAAQPPRPPTSTFPSPASHRLPDATAAIPLTRQFHALPSGVDSYDDNGTPFGAILRGELPAKILAETPRLLAFVDKTPRAPLHTLVIPKRLVGSVLDLTDDDLDLLDEMHAVALGVLQTHAPQALHGGDYLLRFHVPPYASVSHLHLHVLAPASQLSWYHRNVKYRSHTRWCTDFDTVRQQLISRFREDEEQPLAAA